MLVVFIGKVLSFMFDLIFVCTNTPRFSFSAYGINLVFSTFNSDSAVAFHEILLVTSFSII